MEDKRTWENRRDDSFNVHETAPLYEKRTTVGGKVDFVATYPRACFPKKMLRPRLLNVFWAESVLQAVVYLLHPYHGRDWTSHCTISSHCYSKFLLATGKFKFYLQRVNIAKYCKRILLPWSCSLNYLKAPDIRHRGNSQIGIPPEIRSLYTIVCRYCRFDSRAKESKSIFRHHRTGIEPV